MKKNIQLSVFAISLIVFHCRNSTENGIKQGSDGNSSVFQPNALTHASATISASSGGYINVGHTQLVIPAGALEVDTEITVELEEFPENINGIKHLGKGIKFLPEGLQFLMPAELLVCYNSAALNGLARETAMIYYRDENDMPVAISGTIDPVRNCVEGHIEHFSSYVGAAFQEATGNTAPTIGGANFLPATPFAGIPLRVRTQINDRNGGGASGQVVSAFLYYRTVGAPSYTKVALQPDLTDDTVTNRYSYLIPAANVTLTGIQYYFEATDNLNVTRTTTPATRTVPSAATILRLNPATTPGTPLRISSGFARALTLQAADNPGGPWRNISIENHTISVSQMGTAVKTTPSAIRFQGQATGVGIITSTAGALTATLYAEVVPGLLNHIKITDMNQVEITGTYSIGTNQILDFDVVGYDSFGNIAKVLPAFLSTGGIGTVNVNITGAHFTAGSGATTGTLTASVGGLMDSLDFLVYVPPVVASTAPVNGATGVGYLGTGIAITFSKSMDTSTLTAATDGSCSGSIQLSGDNFVTCIPMTSATPQFFIGDTLAMLNAAVPLAGSSVYRIRVLNAAKDTFGYPLPGIYNASFTTVPDVTPPMIGTAILFSDVQNRTMTLSWGAATDDSTAMTNLQYKVVKDNTSAANIATVALADAKTGADLIQNWTANLTTKVVMGLAGTTTYHFAVLVRDLGGNRILYSPATQTTTTWQVAASMAVGRYHHTATLLANGQVLVTGGYNGGSLSSAELYDHMTNTFSAAGSLGAARAFHTATSLASGKILVTGGLGSNGYLSSAELYDPVTNTFSAAGSMAAARADHTATLLATGKVLITGGYNGDNLSSAEIYDPVTNGFSAAGSMAAARQRHTATPLASGNVLVMAGHNGLSNLGSAELYDPVTNVFSAAGSLAAGRFIHTATLLPGGQVLVTGGYTLPTGWLSSAELYDPVTNASSAAGSLPIARYFHKAILLASGKVLVTGGVNGGASLSSAELYDPATNAFYSAGSMTAARGSHTVTQLASGQILITGGSGGGGGALASSELYE